MPGNHRISLIIYNNDVRQDRKFSFSFSPLVLWHGTGNEVQATNCAFGVKATKSAAGRGLSRKSCTAFLYSSVSSNLPHFSGFSFNDFCTKAPMYSNRKSDDPSGLAISALKYRIRIVFFSSTKRIFFFFDVTMAMRPSEDVARFWHNTGMGRNINMQKNGVTTWEGGVCGVKMPTVPSVVAVAAVQAGQETRHRLNPAERRRPGINWLSVSFRRLPLYSLPSYCHGLCTEYWRRPADVARDPAYWQVPFYFYPRLG